MRLVLSWLFKIMHLVKFALSRFARKVQEMPGQAAQMEETNGGIRGGQKYISICPLCTEQFLRILLTQHTRLTV